MNPSAEEVRSAQVSIVKAICPACDNLESTIREITALKAELWKAEHAEGTAKDELRMHDDFHRSMLDQCNAVCAPETTVPAKERDAVRRRTDNVRKMFTNRGVRLLKEMRDAAEDRERLERYRADLEDSLGTIRKHVRQGLMNSLNAELNPIIALLPQHFHAALQKLLSDFDKASELRDVQTCIDHIRAELLRRWHYYEVKSDRRAKAKEVKEQKTVRVTWMAIRDIPAVLCMEHFSSDTPQTENDLREKMRRRDCVGMVARDNTDKAVSFMTYQIQNDKTRMRILDFVVHPLLKERGVEMQMAQALISKLSASGYRSIIIEVSEKDTETVEFWAGEGFNTTLRQGSGEDNGVVECEYVYRETKEYSVAA